MENEIENEREISRLQRKVRKLIVDEKKLLARKLTADRLMEWFRFCTLRDTGEILVFSEEQGFYGRYGEKLIQEMVNRVWQEKCTRHNVSEITAMIQAQTFTDRERLNNYLGKVCVENGVLDLESGTLEKHNPDYLFTFRLPVKYDPNAKCPKIEKFWGEVLRTGDVGTVKQVIGYCLWLDYPAAKFFIFFGTGRNGKSVCMKVFVSLLGQKNVTAISLHHLSTNIFAPARLFGRLANIHPEARAETLHHSEMIKALTGGDYIHAEQKHRNGFDFKNFAKMIFAANKMPVVKDDTHAAKTRAIVIEFPYRFEGEKDNKNLISELTTPEEMSGLLNLAIDGLKKLRENNWEFALSERTKELLEEYHKKADTTGYFIKEWIVDDPLATTTMSYIKARYHTFCEDLGIIPEADNVLSRKLKEARPHIDRCHKYGEVAYRGIRLKDQSQATGAEPDNPWLSLADQDKSTWPY